MFPDENQFLHRRQKEKMLQQNSMVIWFTGLSCSGKTTLANALERKLHDQGLLTALLDGDKIRGGLCSDLGFSNNDRSENIRRVAEVSKLFCNCGIITLCAFISPTIMIRRMAREIISPEFFFEVYVSTPIEVCEQRDTKGLYKKAREGKISDFTGISSPYEAPENPDITINLDKKDINNYVNQIFSTIVKKVKFTNEAIE